MKSNPRFTINSIITEQMYNNYCLYEASKIKIFLSRESKHFQVLQKE